jgi:hypothetical protein
MRNRVSSRAIAVPIVLASCALAGDDPCPGLAFDDDSQFIDLPDNGTPRSVTAGDIDLDGDLDLVVGMAAFAGPDNWVFINPGNGVFGTPFEIPAEGRTEVNRLVDMNRDGYPDLVGASSFGVVVMLNDGAGGFPTQDYYETMAGNGEIEVTDLNGDTFPDIATSSEQQDGISVLLGDGAGGFSPEIFTGGLEHAAGLGIGDLNSDGIPDAVVTLDILDEIAVLFGDGFGGFDLQYITDGGDFPLSAHVTDVNRDGHNDAIVRQLTGPGIHIYLGDGTGNLSAPQQLDVVGGISLWTDSIGTGDLDLDGNLDIVTGTINEGATVLLGRDDGSFLPIRRYGGQGTGASGVVIADLNGDGLVDVAASQTVYPGGLGIVLNECDALCSGADLARPYGDQNLSDISTFVDYFIASNPIADLNRDQSLDLADIVSFVSQFNSDCPGGGD